MQHRGVRHGLRLRDDHEAQGLRVSEARGQGHKGVSLCA
jgi:hypothetical protein